MDLDNFIKSLSLGCNGINNSFDINNYRESDLERSIMLWKHAPEDSGILNL
jgi:hypothetical protein